MSSNYDNLAKLIHDARGPLNKISMNAELVKLVVQNDMPKEKALAALDKIIAACQDCSTSLQSISESVKDQT
ncbi:histidine kinase [Aliiglaciecola sp. LCG003]|uniref:histidine kinase n=1 Tax=Aliiglaciecola sp. LCG003 TaxID=3053655 RepID=UPI002572A7B8|nr:histidine kinase [Aliiglaciecola sp. LCG003]WJG09650.1 histidine kinase [Aliiglaciecola sp. LCG003]